MTLVMAMVTASGTGDPRCEMPCVDGPVVTKGCYGASWTLRGVGAWPASHSIVEQILHQSPNLTSMRWLSASDIALSTLWEVAHFDLKILFDRLLRGRHGIRFTTIVQVDWQKLWGIRTQLLIAKRNHGLTAFDVYSLCFCDSKIFRFELKKTYSKIRYRGSLRHLRRSTKLSL